jgi:hypothetical protein
MALLSEPPGVGRQPLRGHHERYCGGSNDKEFACQCEKAFLQFVGMSRVDLVHEFLLKGFDPNKWNTLALAIKAKNCHMIELLILFGADVNTPLYVTIYGQMGSAADDGLHRYKNGIAVIMAWIWVRLEEKKPLYKLEQCLEVLLIYHCNIFESFCSKKEHFHILQKCQAELKTAVLEWTKHHFYLLQEFFLPDLASIIHEYAMPFQSAILEKRRNEGRVISFEW